MRPNPLPRLDQGEHAADALRLIGRFTWLRAPELGKLIYPDQPHGRKLAERHLRKLVALRLVVVRSLPGRYAGRAFVLSTKGAQFLNDWNAGTVGYTYRAGTDWGSTRDGNWEPPRSWQHDLIATGVLACIKEAKGWGIYPEPQLRHNVPIAKKHPDGLVIIEGKGTLWLEVENARKSGRNIDQLVRSLALASMRRPMHAFGEILRNDTPISMGLVAYNPEARDERGRRLSHLTRIESALRKIPMCGTVKITLWTMEFSLKGVGVDAVKLSHRVFHWPAGRFEATTPPETRGEPRDTRPRVSSQMRDLAAAD